MKTIESLMARARHWQLLILMLAPMLAAGRIQADLMGPGQNFGQLSDAISRIMLVSLPGWVLMYVWIWVLARVCNASLPPALRRKERFLNIGMPFAIAYVIVAAWAFPKVLMTAEGSYLMAPLIIAHLTATVLLFYSAIFAARSVASLGHDRMAGFGRSFLFFLGILYFFVGIWFIQPRLNAAFEESQP
ncbi:MAG: hypothetical protein EX272_01505 [Chromatiales bacterium]|nr:MAG: hypothetical protein EX272_01505 [Chromatiales bacterium]